MSGWHGSQNVFMVAGIFVAGFLFRWEADCWAGWRTRVESDNVVLGEGQTGLCYKAGAEPAAHASLPGARSSSSDSRARLGLSQHLLTPNCMCPAQVAFHSQDPSLVSVIGNGLFRAFRCTETAFKPQLNTLSKRDPQVFP